MADELSTLPRRMRPHTGISQWVECRYSYSDTNPETGNGTDHVAVPDLMPGIIIFVHGVNSEGEWYEDAAEKFADGLNKRLGRKDLERLRVNDKIKHRFLHTKTDGTLYRSPIIPFYWGYKLQGGDLEKYPGIYHEDGDMAWGGGPFQNGTNNLNRFWGNGFKMKLLAGLTDLDKTTKQKFKITENDASVAKNTSATDGLIPPQITINCAQLVLNNLRRSPLKLIHLAAAVAVLQLSACASSYSPPTAPQYVPYAGPIAPSQVVYRIDEHRYFEVVPYEDSACANTWLYYTDTSKGIHTKITSSNGLMESEKFIIDAANDQYLVALVKNSNEDCGADTSDSAACSNRLPYSTDAGRTWKYVPTVRHGPSTLVGSSIFLGKIDVGMLDLSKGEITKHDWKYDDSRELYIPKPHKAPLDTKFHCIPNGKE
ncbi:T6SS effector phospholipase Tle3 domain-containing protein [Collimonas humicola]|uniref:T6SS effector phospholipase Tle3 domain-containing protein n=1 Tax=Collimonas humicola TaxID=2825886 RepID=UPI001B8C35F9|nr:hypothetical protein [Collimonas humicola]